VDCVVNVASKIHISEAPCCNRETKTSEHRKRKPRNWFSLRAVRLLKLKIKHCGSVSTRPSASELGSNPGKYSKALGVQVMCADAQRIYVRHVHKIMLTSTYSWLKSAARVLTPACANRIVQGINSFSAHFRLNLHDQLLIVIFSKEIYE